MLIFITTSNLPHHDHHVKVMIAYYKSKLKCSCEILLQANVDLHWCNNHVNWTSIHHHITVVLSAALPQPLLPPLHLQVLQSSSPTLNHDYHPIVLCTGAGVLTYFIGAGVFSPPAKLRQYFFAANYYSTSSSFIVRNVHARNAKC